MEKMISKELLSEVLSKNILSYEFSMYGNVDYKVVNDYGSCINIYELAHKCKEWARDNYFFLRSFYDYEGSFCYISAPEWVDKIDIPKTGFCSDTEPEAIFKASEYILKEIKK